MRGVALPAIGKFSEIIPNEPLHHRSEGRRYTGRAKRDREARCYQESTAYLVTQTRSERPAGTELLPAQEDCPGGTVSHEGIDSGGSHPSGEIPVGIDGPDHCPDPWRWYRASTSARASRRWITAQSGMPALASS